MCYTLPTPHKSRANNVSTQPRTVFSLFASHNSMEFSNTERSTHQAILTAYRAVLPDSVLLHMARYTTHTHTHTIHVHVPREKHSVQQTPYTTLAQACSQIHLRYCYKQPCRLEVIHIPPNYTVERQIPPSVYSIRICICFSQKLCSEEYTCKGKSRRIQVWLFFWMRPYSRQASVNTAA